jgi:16S rRNA G966 N2-methylase RsmD
LDLGVSERCDVICADVVAALERQRLPGPFGLVLADPPYRSAELCDAFLAAVADGSWLTPEAWAVLERDARRSPAVEHAGRLDRFRSARYGATRLDFYRATASA